MVVNVSSAKTTITVQKAKHQPERRDKPMHEEHNLDQKRVCDVSSDRKIAEIRRKDCTTRITANPDGTLNITHERIAPKAM